MVGIGLTALLALGFVAMGILIGLGFASAGSTTWAGLFHSLVHQYVARQGMLPFYPPSWLADPNMWYSGGPSTKWLSMAFQPYTRPALMLGAAALAGGANRIR